jgi:cytochrome c553
MPRFSTFLYLLSFLVTSHVAAPVLAAPLTARHVAACVACHGKQGEAGKDGYFPRIAGKPSGYLYNQLINFREGRRRYPAMNYLIAHLSDDYLLEMSVYFSALSPPYPAPQEAKGSVQSIERGRELVLQGDRSRHIPACVSCHGASLTGVLPATPGLLGLPAAYINAQLGAWRAGSRKAAAPDCMHQISFQMTPQDISAVSDWLASRPIPLETAPAAHLPHKLPMACGSAPQ